MLSILLYNFANEHTYVPKPKALSKHNVVNNMMRMVRPRQEQSLLSFGFLFHPLSIYLSIYLSLTHTVSLFQIAALEKELSNAKSAVQNLTDRANIIGIYVG